MAIEYTTVDDVYRKAGISSSAISESDVTDHIKDAEAEVEEILGRSFRNGNTFTEWIDTYDENESIEGPEINTIFLSHFPVQAITTMKSYDVDGTLQKTWTGSDYWLDLDVGRIRLRSDEFANQRRRVEVVYTQGYFSVPRKIKDLTASIAAIQILVQQIGGTYDDVTTYSLPTGISVSVGEPYMNMRATIERLEKRVQELLKNIGRYKNNSVVI